MLVGVTLRNRFKIIKELGSGGFGDTYLAEDIDCRNRPCVVKHLQLKPPNTAAALPTAQRLFATEAEVLYKLGVHDQIPTLYADFEVNGQFYLVQELIRGHDLTKEIYPGNKLTKTAAKQLLIDILEILAFIQQKQIIHRDIKPQNNMRRQDGKIILIDFGAVKEITTLHVTTPGHQPRSITAGTIGYMPSEQFQGHPKLSSDIYAVGMLIIYGITGIQPHELPEDPTNGEIIWQNRADVSNGFAKILTKMVRYHFSERYQSAEEVLLALQPSVKTKPILHTRRHFIQYASLFTGGVIVSVIGQNLLTGNKGNTPTSKINTSPNTPTPEITPTPENTTSANNLKTSTFEVVKTNSQGSIISRSNHSANYFVEDLGNSVTLEMVEIPAGTFYMGSPENEKERFSVEGPQHQVTVPRFLVARYPLTQAQYYTITGSNPSYFKGDKRPVEQVSWNNAVAFCEKLSQKTGKDYRLPSEAQWEYACRAGATTPFYFGESITPNLVNYDGNYPYADAPKGQYRGQTTEVGSFPPNAFGLYDMHGNVWEWCLDNWHENYVNAPKDGSAWISRSNEKTIRSGSWRDNSVFCRSAYRLSSDADFDVSHLGFRVVCVSA